MSGYLDIIFLLVLVVVIFSKLMSNFRVASGEQEPMMRK